MKTDKQILIKMTETGKEYFDNSETMDIIEIQAEQQEEWFRDIQDDDVFLCVPIIKSGVFICNYPDMQGRMIFDAEIKDDTISFDISMLDVSDNIPLWMCDCIFEMPLEVSQYSEFQCLDFIDPKTEIYLKQKVPQATIDKHFEKVIENLAHPFRLFIRCMCWINYLMAHPEHKEVTNQERNSSARKKAKITNTTNSQTSSQPRTIFLNNIKFKLNNTKTASKIKSRKIHRIASCWGVRGHFRHYKNGKTIYIQPYQKGENRSERIRKKYQL